MSVQLPINLPARIGILLGELNDVNIAALQYLIVHLNTLQSDFEFELLPVIKQDPFLKLISRVREVNRKIILTELSNFLERTKVFISSKNQEYELIQTTLPDKYILLTMGRFDDDYYVAGTDKIIVLGLGAWKRRMAPPSLLEFFVTLILRYAVALVSPSFNVSVHIGSKGCLFDFTFSLEEARLKALQGFICSDCRASLVTNGYPQLAEHLLPVLDTGNWLGKTGDPLSPAGIVANLGYNLFKTKGIKPTFWEKTQAILSEEGVKEFIKLIGLIIGGIILAFLLIQLGLRK